MKNPNNTNGPKLPGSSPQVITKGHKVVSIWSVKGPHLVFLPPRIWHLASKKTFLVGTVFPLISCLLLGVFFLAAIGSTELCEFLKRNVFCVVDEFLWFRWYFSFASWPAEWYLTHCCFSCQAGLYKLYILLPSALHSQRAPMIRGFLALQLHFERITELWKLLFFAFLILMA